LRAPGLYAIRTGSRCYAGALCDGIGHGNVVSSATNAHHEDLGGWAMLGIVELPVSGCWEITDKYHGIELSFVVDVQP
jgi:hypothetical protein